VRQPLFRLDQTSGCFPFRACRADRRFSYTLYVPASFRPHQASGARVLVVVHGSERAPEAARDLFADLAEETGCIVLAPLFPMAVTDQEEIHNYLFLSFEGIRFDRILLSMVAEVADRFGVPDDGLWLAGFSGGGQFVHRFAYLHASRLAAVSIGAPGLVNTLDPQRYWHIGVRDVAQRFGQQVDLTGLRRLKVQVVVGSADTSNDFQISPGDALYADGVNETGSNRVERADFLNRLLCEAGIDSRLDVVPGAEHSAADVQLAVNAFFRGLRPRAG
jgi:poly(3-hydroxybutyrate) depolymerase